MTSLAMWALPLALIIAKSDSIPTQLTLCIDISKTYQTIDNFGASDAWSCQFVGKWPDEKRNKIADMLFSRDTMFNGSPRGIALSLWRFNIGAGSAQQGDKSGIKDEWRRAASSINEAGDFDPEEQAGQVWFAKAAKARGVKQFLGFCNSPPVQYTINKKAHADNGKTNIAPQHYNDFANFLARAISGLERTAGIKINYLSPLNEPQWDWSDAAQEGCPYDNSEVATLARVIGNNFKANKVSSALIVPEAGNINYLHTPGDKTGKGSQIADLFKFGSPNYIGDVPGISLTVAGHSYFTTSPNTVAVRWRKALANSIARISGLTFWQSEYCILGNNAGEINGNKRDLGMNAALYLARVIHNDLTIANATAWQWWTAVSAYDYKDGLIYVDKNKTDGNFYTSKMLWAMGNYSRFVSPGSVRVNAVISKNETAVKSPLVSAYKHGKDIAVVIVNENLKALSLNMQTTADALIFTKSYTTDEGDELRARRTGNTGILIPAQSVTTLTGIIQ